MRILRIATSSETWPGVPGDLRTPALLAKRLEEATGEPYHFQPEQVVERVEEWLRLVWRNELIVPVIFGPTLTAHHDPDAHRLARLHSRMVACKQRRALCGRLTVAVDARLARDPSAPQGKSRLAADGLHLSEDAHAYEAEVELPYLLEAWRTVHDARAVGVEVAGL